MDISVLLPTVIFITVVVLGLAALKYLEKRMGLIRVQEEEEDQVGGPNKPPAFRSLDDIDYMVEWFIRRDKRAANPLLNSMNIIENLAEETKLEIDLMKTKKHLFNRYLGDLVDFLPKVEKAEQVLREHYCSPQAHGPGNKLAGLEAAGIAETGSQTDSPGAGSMVTEIQGTDSPESDISRADSSEIESRGTEDISSEALKNEEEVHLGSIKSYISAKIRILGWVYYLIYKKWYNQRDSKLLDFTEYFISEAGDTES